MREFKLSNPLLSKEQYEEMYESLLATKNNSGLKWQNLN